MRIHTDLCVQVNLTDGETFSVEVRGGVVTLEEEENVRAEATRYISTFNLESIIAGRLSPSEAYAEGVVAVLGNLGTALRFLKEMGQAW